MKDQNKAYLYALIAVLIWSTVSSAFKVSLRYLDHLELLFFSAVVSLCALFGIMVFQHKLYLLKECEIRDYAHSAVSGLINPFIYYLILFKAYDLLPAQEAQPLNYTWPMMLVILSIFILKQKIKLRSIGAIFICFLGVYIISTRGQILEFSFTSLPGALLALGSAVIWAFFWITNIKDNRDEVLKALPELSVRCNLSSDYHDPFGQTDNA